VRRGLNRRTTHIDADLAGDARFEVSQGMRQGIEQTDGHLPMLPSVIEQRRERWQSR